MSIVSRPTTADYGRDFVLTETPLRDDLAAIDSTLVEDLVRRYESLYAIILYGGVPQIRHERSLIY